MNKHNAQATRRFFRCQWMGETGIIHDPCSGLTRSLYDVSLENGRVQLDEAWVTAMPIVDPKDLALKAPVSVCWSPIVACNLKCPHCLDDKSLATGTKELRFRLAEQIGQSGILGVDISGGEPLLIPELPEMIRLLTQANVTVSVTTNGWFLEKRVRELSGVVDAVRVSFDGSHSGLHDHWRGPGSFDLAVSGLRSARKHKIPLQIQVVAMRSTLHDLQDIVRFATEECVNGLTILQMLPLGEGVKLHEQEGLTDDELREIVSKLVIPEQLSLRIRYRKDAGGFMVIRADGSVYRNDNKALSIVRLRGVNRGEDLHIN